MPPSAAITTPHHQQQQVGSSFSSLDNGGVNNSSIDKDVCFKRSEEDTTTTITTTTSSITATSLDYPYAFFYHYNGGTLGPTNIIGSLTLNSGNKPIRHRIIPLMSVGDNIDNNKNRRMKPIPLLNSKKLDTRSDYVNFLASIAAASTESSSSTSSSSYSNQDDGEVESNPSSSCAVLTHKVAIQNEYGRYVSCRRMAPNHGALAEYRRHLGEFEQFILEHNIAKGTFSFRSHNGLYLHYNKTLRTVAFKPKNSDWATWMVHPLGMNRRLTNTATNNQDDEMEHIIFVGVVEEGNKLVVQRLAEGMDPNYWKTDFDLIIKTIVEEVPVGGCSIFPHPITGQQWCIAKYDDDGTIGIVVSSNNFPPSLATECHDDLTIWYKNSKDPKKILKIQQMGLDLDRITGKELAALMSDYDEQYYISIRNTHLSKLEQDLLDLQNKMTQNIVDLQSNMDSTEALEAKSHDLLEQSKLFKKQTEKLPNSWKHATMLVGVGLGAGAGALAGWLIGGPGGALILATEGMEIMTGTAAAAVLGGSLGATTMVSFWSRKFVKLIFKPSSSTTTTSSAVKMSAKQKAAAAKVAAKVLV